MKPRFLDCLRFGISFVIICVSLSTCQAENSHNNSSLDNEASAIYYVRKGDTAKLPCEINLMYPNSSSINPKWKKISKDSVDMSSKCREEKTDNDNFKCGIILSYKEGSPHAESKNSILTSMLRIQKVSAEDYGTYECRVSSQSTKDSDEDDSLIKKVELREAVTVTRRSSKDTKERSVIVEVDTPFYVYCNYTGLLDEHQVLWFKDEVNITEDLENHSGLFENFTRGDQYEYQGPAIHEHRGFYTCSLELKNASDAINHSTKFPVQFTFHVRVREGNRWIWPASILAGEIILLAAMTLFWWRKVDSVEGGVDGDFADSDDEDETK